MLVNRRTKASPCCLSRLTRCPPATKTWFRVSLAVYLLKSWVIICRISPSMWKAVHHSYGLMRKRQLQRRIYRRSPAIPSVLTRRRRRACSWEEASALTGCPCNSSPLATPSLGEGNPTWFPRPRSKRWRGKARGKNAKVAGHTDLRRNYNQWCLMNTCQRVTPSANPSNRWAALRSHLPSPMSMLWSFPTTWTSRLCSNDSAWAGSSRPSARHIVIIVWKLSSQYQTPRSHCSSLVRNWSARAHRNSTAICRLQGKRKPLSSSDFPRRATYEPDVRIWSINSK